MRRTLLAGVVALAATGANAQAVIDGSDASVARRDAEIVIGMISKYLRDPSTAQIKSLVDTGDMTYCGLVNAKTAFGGYAGFRKFLVRIGPSPLVIFQAVRNDGQFEPSAAIMPLPNPGQGCLPNS